MRALSAKPKTPNADGKTGTAPLLSRHRVVGAPLQIQRKLSVGATNDPLEHEADRIADQVMRIPDAAAGPHALGPAAPPEAVLTKSASSDGTAGAFAAPPVVQEVLNSPGQPLDAATRAFMEPRFGHDFSQVRVHTDPEADRSARAVRARAYAASTDIVFDSDSYQPDTQAGRRLLAHELAHVMQQGGAPQHGPIQRQANPWEPQDAKSADKTDWKDVIPEAVVKAPDKAQAYSASAKNAHAAMTDFGSTMFSYHQAGEGDKQHRIAQAGDLSSGVTQVDVDAAVAQIVEARATIQHRYLPKTDAGGYRGYSSTTGSDAGLAKQMAKKKPSARAVQESNAHPDWKHGTDTAESYKQWLDTAVPTSVKNAKTDKKWLIYKTMMPWEGDPSAVNAYDKANVTWGSGFAASGGQVQELTQLVFAKDTDLRDEFHKAGIAIEGGDYVVVDTGNKWKLRGKDAELYIRSNTELLSLMINAAQGTQPKSATLGPAVSPFVDRPASFFDYLNPWGRQTQADAASAQKQRDEKSANARQAVLDANYEMFLLKALANIPPSVLSWDTGQAALAAHAVHAAPGIYKWPDIGKLDPHTIADVAEYIHDKSIAWYEVIVVPKAWKKLVTDRKDAAAKATTKGQ
jgi:hypothetical protein